MTSLIFFLSFFLLQYHSFVIGFQYRQVFGKQLVSKSLNRYNIPFNRIVSNLKSQDSDVVASVSSTKSSPSFISPEIFAILTVYFIQGALGISSLATSFFLKDQLHLDPAASAALLGITTIPWIIKPIYGLISDGIPLFGSRRRSYLLVSGIIGFLSWLLLGTLVTSPNEAITALFFGSMSIAFSDVVADSIVVEKTNEQQQINNNNIIPVTTIEAKEDSPTPPNTAAITIAGDLQSICWMSSSIGSICSAYYSGALLLSTTPQQIFLYTALCPLFISLVSFFINERTITIATPTTTSVEEASNNNTFQQEIQIKIKQVLQSLFTPSIYLPLLFIVLWQATPTPSSAMFYYYTNILHFSPEILGRVRLVSAIASLLGIVLYRQYLKNISIKKVFLWTALISVPLSLTPLLLISHINQQYHIPDDIFLLTDSAVLTVLGQISFMPILALAASLCPPGIEGTLFASIMSIFNAAGTISSELGAWLTQLLQITDQQFDQLPILIVICSLSSLLPLPWMNKLLSGTTASTSTTSSIDVVQIDDIQSENNTNR
jgi:hypothetical protein